LVAANLSIGRVLQPAARVADCRRRHTLHAPKRRLDSPEAAGAECRLRHITVLPEQPCFSSPPSFLDASPTGELQPVHGGRAKRSRSRGRPKVRWGEGFVPAWRARSWRAVQVVSSCRSLFCWWV